MMCLDQTRFNQVDRWVKYNKGQRGATHRDMVRKTTNRNNRIDTLRIEKNGSIKT